MIEVMADPAREGVLSEIASSRGALPAMTAFFVIASRGEAISGLSGVADSSPAMTR